MLNCLFPLSARLGLLLWMGLALGPSSAAAAAAAWWSKEAQTALEGAGTNQAELARALHDVPQDQRRSLEFLLENMPERDRRTLSADFLLRHVAMAHEALLAAPWRDRLPQDVFLNDVLPYACANETRDESRARLRELCVPLVRGTATAGEAAQKINRELFPLVKVAYNTGRKKPDQSGLETMASGKATCTGLSILLVQACRAVGVPARLAGTPMWTNMRGNHTWAEVWDEGWHFVGAAEPDPAGLDRGWFVHDAAQALPDVPEHAIYATSFRKTDIPFPLVWAPSIKWVYAVNVTPRYLPKAAPVADGRIRLLVKVLDAPGGKRVAAPVTLLDPTDSSFKKEGTSRTETADLNDILPFEVLPNHSYTVGARGKDHNVERAVKTGTNAQEIVTLTLTESVTVAFPSQACYAPPPVSKALSKGDATKLRKAVSAYFAAPASEQANWKFPATLDRVLSANEPAVRQLVWETYKESPVHQASRANFDEKKVSFDTHVSPYTVKTVGTRPKNGWALFIAMHGGGGAPKEVNDSQWEVMQRYYRDHPEVGGYRYVALRAPNDTWNGFYDLYVYPLVGNLIRQFLLFGDVDSNKVFLMGYSHGGYGAFAIGPKMPDRFAAIHASAAAPTDGETTARTLRNTIFTAMVGEKDTAYGRIDRNRRFSEEVAKLQAGRTDIYPVRVDVKEGFGHGGLPDRDIIPSMYSAVRNPVPAEITWLMTDPVIKEFYWLHVPEAAKGREIWASFNGNRYVFTGSNGVDAATVYGDRRMLDLSKPVDIELNGSTTSHPMHPSLRTLCETMVMRGDPELAFTARLEIRKNAEGVLKVVKNP